MTATFTPGQKVMWLWETNKGYGYREWVSATVVKTGPKRVTIDVDLKRGGVKRKTVTPERLATDRTGIIAWRLRNWIYRDEAEAREHYTDLTAAEWDAIRAAV